MAFRKPAVQKIGGKFFVYGMEHEGKSWFGLTFPEIAAIDSEVGLAFDEGRDIEINNKKYNNLVGVDTTADLDDLEENLDGIIDGDTQCKTLLIDSETKFYNTMDIASSEVEEKKAQISGKNVDNRSKWGRVKNINMKLQQAKISASARGIHVVSTAQASEIKDDDNKKVIGYKPEVHKSLKFDYDVVLRFYTEVDKKSGKRRYFAEVEKDRTHVTTKGDIIENCTYDTWKEYFEGREKIGKDSTANFSKDLKNSVDSVVSDAEKSEKLANEFKSLLKTFKDEPEKASKAKSLIREKEIDIKELHLLDPSVLKDLIKSIESL